jgi:hypothetical protein
MYWKRILDVLPIEDKMLFLEELLEKNEPVRSQFISRFKRESFSDPLLTKASLLRLFDEEKAEVLNKLEGLDFVNFDWEAYVPRHSGYIPDYEACEHLAEDMAREVLSIPRKKILAYVRQGKVAEGAMLLAAVYQACTEAYYEENYALEDTEEEFLSLFQPAYEEVLIEVKTVIINNNQILVFFEALFTQYAGFGEDLKYFEPLLKSLVQNEKIAGEVQELLKKHKVGEEFLPQLLLQIYELLGNREYWLDHAHQYFKQDKELAEKLMHHYLKEERKKFLNTAEEVFTVYPHTFDRFILENLDIKEERNFYKMVLRRITGFGKDVNAYRTLKELLSPQEKELFYAGIRDKVFLVRIFELENLYDRILQLIYANPESWDLNEMIIPIIPVYPRECLGILENKINQSLANERGRSVYKRIVGWMELLRKIPGQSVKTNEIIMEAYHHKPSLPALKDEMRKAGLALS